MGFESGPPGTRTLNPPGKSRLLCAIELTAREEGVLPVKGSNLGFRVQSAASCQLDERASAPGPGVEPGPADPKSAVLPATPTGNESDARGSNAVSPGPEPGGVASAPRIRRKPRRPLGAGPVPLPGLEPGASAFVVRRSFPLSYRGVRPAPATRRRTASGRRASNPLLRFGRPTCPPSSPRPREAPWAGRSGEGGSRTLIAAKGARVTAGWGCHRPAFTVRVRRRSAAGPGARPGRG